MSDPNNKNTVLVSMAASSNDPSTVIPYVDGKQAETIEFDNSKKFIKFSFPDTYSGLGIRVFELDETDEKLAIMNAYQRCNTTGFDKFDAQWSGQVSSGGKNREFKQRGSHKHELVIRDLDKDGCEQGGTLHNYILSFTYTDENKQSQRYLQDPRIRNMDTN